MTNKIDENFVDELCKSGVWDRAGFNRGSINESTVADYETEADDLDEVSARDLAEELFENLDESIILEFVDILYGTLLNEKKSGKTTVGSLMGLRGDGHSNSENMPDADMEQLPPGITNKKAARIARRRFTNPGKATRRRDKILKKVSRAKQKERRKAKENAERHAKKWGLPREDR